MVSKLELDLSLDILNFIDWYTFLWMAKIWLNSNGPLKFGIWKKLPILLSQGVL